MSNLGLWEKFDAICGRRSTIIMLITSYRRTGPRYIFRRYQPSDRVLRIQKLLSLLELPSSRRPCPIHQPSAPLSRSRVLPLSEEGGAVMSIVSAWRLGRNANGIACSIVSRDALGADTGGGRPTPYSLFFRRFCRSRSGIFQRRSLYHLAAPGR